MNVICHHYKYMSLCVPLAATDETMLEKLHATHGTKTIYLQPKSSQSFQFGIQHFAGVVSYNPVGMCSGGRRKEGGWR